MSPALAFIGISIIGTWGLATIGLIAGGIILIFFPGDPTTASDNTLGGVILLVVGLASGGLMQMVVGPLLGIDPPFPIRSRTIIPHAKMKRWESAGELRDFPDGMPKEIRLRSRRITIIRQGETAYAINALCSHARLPIAGFPSSPVKAQKVQDDCVMCPFHGARFEIQSGKVVTQPFSSQFNHDHPFLGRVQSKLMFWNKTAEDIQTYPVKVEDGEIIVGLPK